MRFNVNWVLSISLIITPISTLAQQSFLFAFGDSYTTDGFDITAGINSTATNFTSSNGPNWADFLTNTYNTSETKLFNLGSGGATIDSELVVPFAPTVKSIVDQVAQFKEFLAPKPFGAKWSSNNSLFAFWIGINDVGNSFNWTNVTQVGFHQVLMTRLFGQVEELYKEGARSFVFLSVPPTNRAPLLLVQGPEIVAQIASSIADYNAQLVESVNEFAAKHRDVKAITFDTQPVFNALLDQADVFGYVNVTGFCEAYQDGTPELSTQIEPCAPVSNYFWLNTLHPLFTVHDAVSRGITKALKA